LREPKHEIITIGAGWTDEMATKVVKSALAEGQHGKKLLLKIEETI
jgi:mitochondrial enoyl-[acyl-carrier protein] reductase / trans-2-enoyl-CoA reductase